MGIREKIDFTMSKSRKFRIYECIMWDIVCFMVSKVRLWAAKDAGKFNDRRRMQEDAKDRFFIFSTTSS